MSNWTPSAGVLFTFIQIESSFNPRAFLNDRNGGSYGLGQLDLATAEDRGFKGTALELYDPVVNVEYLAKHLIWLEEELEAAGKFSEENLAAAYNSGLGHVLKGGKDPDYTGKWLVARKKWALALGEAPNGS